jgi:hypothetical protein
MTTFSENFQRVLASVPEGKVASSFNEAVAGNLEKQSAAPVPDTIRLGVLCAEQDREDKEAIDGRVRRLYTIATAYCDGGEEDAFTEKHIRDILSESANPVEAAHVALRVMQMINTAFGHLSSRTFVERFLNAVR